MPSDHLSDPAVLVVIGVAAVLLLATLVRRGAPRRNTGASYHRRPVLSSWERSALGLLGLQLRPGLHLCPQVRLAELLEVQASDPACRQGAQNRINSKSVDFVIVDVASGQPVLVVELDDRSHDLPHRQRRDAFVDDALRAAGIPIVHFRSSQKRLDIQPHLAAALTSLGVRSMPAAAE